MSEHDEAEKADLEDLAAKLAEQVEVLRTSGSGLGHIPTGLTETEFAIRWALIHLHGILYGGGPLHDQVRRVLGITGDA